MVKPVSYPQLTHWGMFDAQTDGGEISAATSINCDEDPSPLTGNLPGSVRHRSRIESPAVRRGWLEHGPGPDSRRGSDSYVPVEWDEVVGLLAGELNRVSTTYGCSSIFGGSYGWSSAGRFHHAQSQVHRFLNGLGGFTRSVGNYSNGASQVILPRVLGPEVNVFQRASSWPVIARHSELIVSFGGISAKNVHVAPGGVAQHQARRFMHEAVANGARLILVSPIGDDAITDTGVWWPVIPGTDVAVMLGLAHTLIAENLYDHDFIARYTVGFARFERYVLGLDDGAPKSAEWAASISGLDADSIRALARDLVRRRSLITVSYSLQRADHGEQPTWMAVVLAALVGQIGLPGGGFGHGYGSMAEVGTTPTRLGMPTLPLGTNRVLESIPVARIADALLHPGAEYDFDGARLRYPKLRLVYWCGGNPFHHHQDLGRLVRAFYEPDTVVVHDPYWTATARHADIILPSTTPYERNDIGGGRNTPLLVAMHQVVRPYQQARNDYVTFAELAGELGFGEWFTQGRNSWQWLESMYGEWRDELSVSHGLSIPEFGGFWRDGFLKLPESPEIVLLSEFRTDPAAHPLGTPSGRIEIFSAAIDSFAYEDCPGHPTWLEPAEWLGSKRAERYPLHLIADQPRTRLHSQLDHGATSQASKVRGREPIRLNPVDAAARGIVAGDVVRVHNDRGSCLAGAVISPAVRPSVVQLSAGAWYDPVDPTDPRSMCAHGNVNVLTLDKGTSGLAQACIGQHALVEVEKFLGSPPPVRAFEPPVFKTRPQRTKPAAGCLG